MLECNETTVLVFQSCEQALSIGMGGGVWQGIAAQEILSACRLLHIPRREWPDVTGGVRYMGTVVAGDLNKRKR